METENINNIEEIETTETETAATEPEMEEVPEYLVPDEDETDDETETEEGMSMSTKLVLGAVGAALVGGAVGGGILLRKRRKAKELSDADGENLGPRPLSDKVAKVKAVRGRKLTLREKLTGRLYLDPAEVEMFKKLQEMEVTQEES